MTDGPGRTVTDGPGRTDPDGRTRTAGRTDPDGRTQTDGHRRTRTDGHEIDSEWERVSLPDASIVYRRGNASEVCVQVTEHMLPQNELDVC